MRQLFFTVCIATLSFCCGSSDKKEKDPVTKDTISFPPPDTATKQPVNPPTTADTTKTVKLTFSGYDEGDYAHLLFTETGTSNEYDFGHPEDNNLDNIPVVIKDNNTSFGYKVNNKMKGTKYVAELVYKMTDTYDDSGQPKKGKEWRIVSIKKAE
ncbi:MAG: hypothetical protein SGI96_03165 [Bacteroidota bacterium]|nr:hypothetical protein [Bacteroidota bacterium]